MPEHYAGSRGQASRLFDSLLAAAESASQDQLPQRGFCEQSIAATRDPLTSITGCSHTRKRSRGGSAPDHCKRARSSPVPAAPKLAVPSHLRAAVMRQQQEFSDQVQQLHEVVAMQRELQALVPPPSSASAALWAAAAHMVPGSTIPPIDEAMEQVLGSARAAGGLETSAWHSVGGFEASWRAADAVCLADAIRQVDQQQQRQQQRQQRQQVLHRPQPVHHTDILHKFGGPPTMTGPSFRPNLAWQRSQQSQQDARLRDLAAKQAWQVAKSGLWGLPPQGVPDHQPVPRRGAGTETAMDAWTALHFAEPQDQQQPAGLDQMGAGPAVRQHNVPLPQPQHQLQTQLQQHAKPQQHPHMERSALAAQPLSPAAADWLHTITTWGLLPLGSAAALRPQQAQQAQQQQQAGHHPHRQQPPPHFFAGFGV